MKCWCTMPIPCSIASCVEPSSIGLPFEQDLALVGRVEPVEDVHQRRLAGAVLAEQRMDLAAAQVEVDVVVGEHAREPLRDPAQLEQRCLRHRSRDPTRIADGRLPAACAGGARADARWSAEIRGSRCRTPTAPLAAPNTMILAAVVDAARPHRARSGPPRPPAARSPRAAGPRWFCWCAPAIAAAAQSPPRRHHDRRAARDRPERRLLARGRAVRPTTARRTTAAGRRSRGRRGRTPSRAPGPAGRPRRRAAAARSPPRTTRPATTPPSRAASSSRNTRPARFGSGGAFVGRADDARSATVDLPPPLRGTRCAACVGADDDHERVGGDLRASVPVLDHRAGHLHRRAGPRRRRAGPAAACSRRRASVVVVVAARFPPPQPPQRSSAQHEQSRRRPHPATKAERGGPCGPPRP